MGIFRSIGDYFKRTDIIFWLLTIVATFYGCLLIASQQRAGDVNFLRTQIMAVCLGYAAAVVISLIDYNFIASCWWLIGGVALALTFAVFFIGIRIEGTDDVGWISLPGGMTFQPSELTKICFIVTFSKHLTFLIDRDRLHSFVGVLSLVIHAGIPIALIHMQGDDGAALIFGCMFLIMSYAAGVQLRYFIIFFSLIAAALPFVWTKLRMAAVPGQGINSLRRTARKRPVQRTAR